jgi:hypothetical protein
MENCEVVFNINDTDNFVSQVEEELSELRSYIDDYKTECGALPPILNNYTVMRALEIINTLKDLNNRFDYVEKKKKEFEEKGKK